METLVVVSQHRNHYYSRNKNQIHGRFNSSLSGGFKDINCRFQSAAGILPTPLKFSSNYSKTFCSSTVTKEEISPPQSERKGNLKNGVKNNVKSSPIPIKMKARDKEKSYEDDFCYSELWAGPAYSISPPPSSLPIPKFSMPQMRSVSLDLIVTGPGIKFHTLAKSAPSSPRREICASPPPDNFLSNTDSATKNLRRILHLDVADE